MKTYAVTLHETGELLGHFEGETREEAVAAFVASQGYSSIKDAAEAVNQTVAEFIGSIVTKEDE